MILDTITNDLIFASMSSEKLEQCLSFYQIALLSDSLSDEERSKLAKKIRLITDILECRNAENK